MKRMMQLFKNSICNFISVILITALLSGVTCPFMFTTADKYQEKLYLKVALKEDIKTLNPTQAIDMWTRYVIKWIWEETVVRDPDTLKIVPWIALEWYNWKKVDENGNEIPDYMNWTVVYRTGYYNADKDLKFHDGHVVDIYDIVFSYALILQEPRWAFKLDALDKTPNGTVIPPEGLGKYGGIPMIKGISIINDHTLRIKLNFTCADFETNILKIPIFPWHAWRDHFNPADRSVFEYWDMDDDGNPANGAPGMLGCGMFKFVKWDKVAFYSELETYKDFFPWNKKPPNWNKEWYWETKINRFTRKPYGEGNHVPIIDGIQFKIYMKTDLAVMALKKGEVDYIAWAIDPSYLPELEADPNIGVFITDETGFYYCGFNMRKLPFGYDYEGNDIGLPLRKAIAYATDKETIVSKLLQVYGAVGTSPINLGNTYWYNPYIPTYPYDLEKAKKILDEQGWIDKNGNGWRELPGVGDAQLTFIYPIHDYDYVMAEAARMLAESLRKIGLNVKNLPLSYGDVLARISARDMDFYFSYYPADLDDLEPDFMYKLFHSSQIGPGLHNEAGYQNESYDEIIEAARRELDPMKRRELIWKCQQIIVNDLPINVLYYRDLIEGYRKDKFSRWYQIINGIFNKWSLLFIHKRGAQMNLKMQISDVILIPRVSTDITITVADTASSNPIENAVINLTCSPSSPNIKPGRFEKVLDYQYVEYDHIGGDDVHIKYIVGTTLSNGVFKIKYEAPMLSENESLTVVFEVLVQKDDYEPAFTSQSVCIYFFPARILEVELRSESDTMQSAESTIITAYVATLLNEQISDIKVFISAEPKTGAHFNCTTATTDEMGIAKFVFTPRVPTDVPSIKYKITASTEIPDGYDGVYTDTITITVYGVLANFIVIAPSSVESNNAFKVVVKDIAGNMIDNATITFANYKKISPSNGTVWFTAPYVEKNTVYRLNVTKAGYKNTSVSITVIPKITKITKVYLELLYASVAGAVVAVIITTVAVFLIRKRRPP
jgi:ABC-type transport system substrate-binding protein